jgi:serine protease Do
MKVTFKFPFGTILTILGVIWVYNSLSGISYPQLHEKTAPKIVLLAPYEAPVLTAKLHIGEDILVFKKQLPFSCHYRMGSGVFVREDGIIITAAHVTRGTSLLRVETVNGRVYRAAVIARDVEKDLALLKVVPEPNVAFKVARIGKERPSGWSVYAVGNPLGLPWLITSGIISGYLNDTLLSDTVINPGSSGGGLFDVTNGRLEGITVGTISPIQSSGFMGHSVFVRSKIVKDFLERSLPLCG